MGRVLEGINIDMKHVDRKNTPHTLHVVSQVQIICLFGNKTWHLTSIETIMLIRDGEPRTATLAFTLLLSSALCWIVSKHGA